MQTSHYAGNYHYEQSSLLRPFELKFFSQPEGYVAYNAGIFSYIYQYKDHLGNNRLSYSDSNNDGRVTASEIKEEDNYYPFGLKHKGYNSVVNGYNPSKYKYNGKELQEEFGLNVYDYGNRNYDPAIGRFHNMDRFAEKYYNLNPYQYGANNPVLYNDIKGDSILIYSKQDKANVKYENGNLYSMNAKSGKWETYNGKNVKVDKNGNKTIGGFLGKAVAALNKIRSGTNGDQLVGDLQNASKYIRIGEGKNGSGGESGSVSWDPSNSIGGPNQLGNSNRASYIGLAHELGHAHDGLDGPLDQTSMGMIGSESIPIAELYSMGWENKVRYDNNLPLRTHYGNNTNGDIVGPNSLLASMLSSVQLQVNYSNPSGMQIIPVSTTSTTVIPIKNF